MPKKIIQYNDFSKLVDLYQYTPLKVKKDRNFSSELYYVMTSNKAGGAGYSEQKKNN